MVNKTMTIEGDERDKEYKALMKQEEEDYREKLYQHEMQQREE